MKKVILFSSLTEVNREEITSLLFLNEIENKSFAFMPSDGIANCKQEYIDTWQDMAQNFNADFVVVDNLAENTEEQINKLKNSNVLMISGGNTFKLLDNLRKSGLDEAIRAFTHKENFILCGYSAGALVLTPSIEICNLPKYDENTVGITDLAGLQVVDFEIFPHYRPEDEKFFDDYVKTTKRQVKTITNDGFIDLDIS